MICGQLTNYRQVYKLAKNVSGTLGGVADAASLKVFIQKTLDQTLSEFGQNANLDYIVQGLGEFIQRMEIIKQVPLTEVEKMIKDLWTPNSDIIPVEQELKSPHENGIPKTYDNEAPGIDRFYTNSKHREVFRKNFQNDLIRSVFINQDENYLITDNSQLNASIKALKNNLARELANYLNVDVTYIYDEFGELDLDNYQSLMTAGNNKFTKSNYSRDTDSNSRRNFNRFYTLKYFDQLIKKYSKDVLTVREAYEGSINEPEDGIKYKLDGKKTIVKEYEESDSDIFDHTNEAVRLFIESIPRTIENSKGQNILTDDYITMNNFNKVMSLLSIHGKDIMEDLRGDPEETFYKILVDANNNPKKYFSSDSHMIPIFKDIHKSLMNLYEISKNNPSSLYGMIANTVNKLTTINYLQYGYDAEAKQFITKTLDPEELGVKKGDLERDLTSYGKYENFEELMGRYAIEFDLINKVIKMTTSKRSYNIPLDTSSLKLKFEDAIEDTDLMNFLTEITDRKVDQDILSLIYQKNGLAFNQVFNLAGNILLNNYMANQLEGLKNDTSSRKHELNRQLINSNFKSIILGNNKSDMDEKLYYNSFFGALRVGGFNNGGIALNSIVKAQALLKGEDNRSYVKDATKNNLPLFRLPNVINNDQYLFKDLRSLVSKKIQSIGDFNLFTTTDEILGDTRLKTKVINKDNVIKTVSDLNTSDLIYTQFMFDYLGQDIGEKEKSYGIQPTTYADKSQIWIKTVRADKPINFTKLDGGTLNIPSLREASSNEVAELHFETMRGMISRLKSKLLEDYRVLFNQLEYKNPETYEEAIETLESKNPSENDIYKAIINLNLKNIKLDLVPEIHYIFTKKGDNVFIKGNQTLQNMIKIYNENGNMSEYYKKLNSEKKLYGYLLQKNSVKFNTMFSNGIKNTYLLDKLNKSVGTDFTKELTSDSLNKLKRLTKSQTNNKLNYDSIWINNNTKELVNFYVLKKSTKNLWTLETDYDLDKIKYDEDYRIVLNPELDKFFSMDNLVTDNYNAVTVGLPFIHKTKTTAQGYYDKAKKDGKPITMFEAYKKEESERTIASSKRAVVYGATIHPFLKNKIDGIPNSYKIAVIKDPVTKLFNLQGNRAKQDQFDGSCIANPFLAIWEANSLTELNLSPVHRKSIGMVPMPGLMGSMTLKWATFTLTNEFMINSNNKYSVTFDGEMLMKKMTDKSWIIPNLDITDGGKIKYSGFYYDPTIRQYVKIKSITRLDPVYTNGKIQNFYKVDREIVTKDGDTEYNLTDKYKGLLGTNSMINSNYDLWKVLGGQYSMGFNSDNYNIRELRYNESSIEKVAKVSSEISIRNSRAELLNKLEELRSIDPEYHEAVVNDVLTNVNMMEGDILFKSQKYYFQPMKHSDIHYAANSSAVKNGATNINPSSAYSDETLPLIYSTINTDFLGIQLNADHEVDNSHTTEMTQVMSAAEENGTTHDLANAMYIEIGRSIEDNLKVYTQHLKTDNKEELYKTLGKYLCKTFLSGEKDNISLAISFMQLVRPELEKDFSSMKYRIPFDDPNIFGAFLNGFTNNINQTAIRRTYAGIGAILNPSQDFITVYEDTTGNIFKMTDLLDPTKDHEALLKSMDVDTNVGRIEIGDFIEYNGEVYLVQGYNDEPKNGKIGLIQVKALRKTNGTIRKLGSKGRNLKNTNHQFEIDSSNIINGHTQFDVYDLDSSLLSHTIEDFYEQNFKNGKFKEDANEFNTNLYNIFLEINERVKAKFPGKELKIGNAVESNNYIKQIIQEDLDNIEKNNIFPIPYDLRIDKSKKESKITDDSKVYKPYEMMLGATWASKFGLRRGDSINEILNKGGVFFQERSLENNKTVLKNYDMYLTKSNGNHLHIMLNTEANRTTIARMKSLGTIKDLSIATSMETDGEYRVIGGNREYPINDGLKFYTVTAENGQSRELVLVNNAEDVKNIISGETFDDLELNYNISTDTKLNDLYKFILEVESESTFNSESDKGLARKALQSESLEEAVSYINNYTERGQRRRINTANKKFTSFQQALDFIVARIPAQSMQSYMNMRIVGFIDAPTNIVYVPAMQLYLQGSDFDIDKAYILGAGISDQGTYYDWSPLFNYTSKETLTKSNELPIPNGVTYLFDGVNGSPVDYTGLENLDESNYWKLFSQNPELISRFAKFLEEIQNLKVQKLNIPENLLKLVNKHTTYKLVGPRRIEAIKNKVYHLLKTSGSNIRNFIAQTNPISMDELKDAASKSSSGKDSEIVSNANPASKMMMQDQNAVGKGVIGISATGAKVAASILHYYNEALSKSINSINESQKDLYANKLGFLTKVYDISIDGETAQLKAAPTMPNLNFGNYDIENKGTLFVKDLSDKVKDLGFQEDIFMPLSQIISAATDNAKELILEKINAGTDLAGVYIYLILLGEDLNKIAKYMTSPSISLVQRKARQSIFNDHNSRNTLNNAISYYLNGVDTEIFGLDNILGSIDKYLEDIYAKDASIEALAREIVGHKKQINSKIKDNEVINKIDELLGGEVRNKDHADAQLKFIELLNAYLVADSSKVVFKEKKRPNKKSVPKEFFDYDDYASAQEEFSAMMLEETDSEGYGYSKPLKENSFLLFRYLEESKRRLEEVKDFKKEDFQNIKTLKNLKDDSKEINTMGKLTRVNQGIPTKQLDKINLRLSIENFVNDKLRTDETKAEPFDLFKFTGNEEYAQMMIQRYNGVKTLFNILDIIHESPHFSKMWEAYNVNMKSLNESTIKNELSENLVRRLVKDGIIENTPMQNDLTRVNAFLQDNIINKFLTHRVRKPIEINSDQISSRYNDSNGLVPFSGSYRLDFRNQYDRATFKFWVERYLIPELKRSNSSQNRFIKDLTLTTYKDLRGDLGTLYKLPINMRQEKPSEQVAFADYLDQFTQIKDQNIIGDYTMEDVFFIYNLLVNKNQFGEFSLTKIFDNSINEFTDIESFNSDTSLVLDFFNFENSLVYSPELQFRESDYNYNDLKLSFVKRDKINDNVFVRKFEDGRSYIVDEKNNEIVLFKENNTINLPFLMKSARFRGKDTRENLLLKLRTLLDSKQAEILLNCN